MHPHSGFARSGSSGGVLWPNGGRRGGRAGASCCSSSGKCRLAPHTDTNNLVELGNVAPARGAVVTEHFAAHSAVVPAKSDGEGSGAADTDRCGVVRLPLGHLDRNNRGRHWRGWRDELCDGPLRDAEDDLARRHGLGVRRNARCEVLEGAALRHLHLEHAALEQVLHSVEQPQGGDGVVCVLEVALQMEPLQSDTQVDKLPVIDLEWLISTQ
mmetsp:Transcript_18918/g.44336  ORF Transcript_18918/g.44336 Transcript_18918/m.44336 type:complete len:213 (-) Transcript_18918:832-1470(-)